MGTAARRNRIITAAAPRIAAHDAFGRKPASIEQAVGFERVDRIDRARRFIPARSRQQRGNDDFVEPNQENKGRYEDFSPHQNVNVVPSLPSLSCMPSASNWSRIWSESAKSLSARAWLRIPISILMSPSILSF